MPIHDKAEKVATYVSYEKYMFDKSFQLLKEVSPKSFLPVALLECFLLHARILRDFLFGKHNEKKDDVFAKHFFETPSEWVKSPEDVGPYLTENKARLDKALAHLTYARIGYEPFKGWNLIAIDIEINEVWTEFWSKLPVDRQAWFTQPRRPSS